MNNFYGVEKRSNETDFEFCLRVCMAKHNKEIDADWSEIVESFPILNQVHRDTLRKNFVGKMGVGEVVKFYEDKIANMVVEVQPSQAQEDLLLELEMKKIELQKERVKISTLRNELNKTIREESRKELFYANIRDAVVSNPLEPVQFDICYEQQPSKEYLLTFADVHYGSTFDVGINKYSPEICQERFNQLFSETVELIEEEGINHLYIASLGDLIQGVLRLSDVKLNSISMIEQVMGIARLVANFLNQLSQYCKITYLHVINANHSELRLLGSKSGELQEDVELLIGSYIKDLLVLNNRVEVIIGDDSVMDINLCGYNIGLTHGQHIKNKESYIKDLSATRHKHYDFLILGHIHHYSCVTVSTTQDGNPTQVISVPSVVGSCPYSQKIMKTSPSGALLLCFKENHGKINTYEINLK